MMQALLSFLCGGWPGVLKTLGQSLCKPPGLYLALLLSALLLLAGSYSLGRHAGAQACAEAHQIAAWQQQRRMQTDVAAAVSEADSRAVEDAKAATRNQEDVRNVTREAAHLADQDAVCIPATLADRLRRIE